MPVGEWVSDAHRCFPQLPGAHVPLAERAAPRHAEAVDGLLTVVELDDGLSGLCALHGFLPRHPAMFPGTSFSSSHS